MIQPFRKRLQFCVAVAVLAGTANVVAEPAPVVTASIQAVSPEQFQVHVRSLQQLVQACEENAANCDASKVGVDDRVDSLHFQMRWVWLRKALIDAHDAKLAGRAELLQSAAGRLDEIAKENGAPEGAEQAKQFATARADADRILSSSEFQSVQQQSWWSREVAKFWAWLGKKMSGAGVLGALFPWVGRLLEWLLFGGAAVGLLFFVRRNLQRQRLAVALNAKGSELAWKRESTEWASLAEASARAGDWRDAVHCLYWATIVMLEGRRAWRHNPSRTPREYVRLLKPGSEQQGALRGLTQIFERLWYGLRDAKETDYERARALYEGLRDSAPVNAGAA